MIRILSALALLTASMTLTACSSFYVARYAPISSDSLPGKGGPDKIKSMGGDRRLVRVHLAKPSSVDGTVNTGWLICAETQADAIFNRTGKSEITATEKGSISDEAIENSVTTFQRTELSDVLRQSAWHICNAYMNGVITKSQYANAIISLTSEAVKTATKKSSN